MKTEETLNEDILKMTEKIRKNHPELLKYLNELPVTIPSKKDPSITINSLSSYLDSLVEIVEAYEDNNSKNIQVKNSSNAAETKNIEMKNTNSHNSSSVEVNNSTISYNDVGEGSIPIIFLHGFPFNKSMWNDQLDTLKSEHRAIALDLRGFGKSTNENLKLSMDLYGQDLIAFLDKLKIDKAIICGLSMGGYIALNAMKNFPDRFKALILCDTQCNADSAEGKEKRYKTIEQIKREGTADFNENFIKSVFYPDSLKNKQEVVESLRNVVTANSKEAITAGLGALAERSETCTSLNIIRVPTLIICGREDELTPLAQSEYIQKHIDGSVLRVIANAGHVSNLEQPEEFNKYLTDFLDSLKT